jgi:outer membrane immunogenic protein
MRRSLLAGIALLPLLALPTFAAEIPVQARPKAAPPARPVAQPAQAPSNWSGSQVGGFNGASNMSNSFVEPGAFLFFAPSFGASPSVNVETPFDIKRHPWSYTAGVFVGYNWQLGNYVVGGEGDIAWKNAQSTSSLYTTTVSSGFLRTESFNGTIKQSWDSSIRARGGFLITPWTLIYGTGGVAFGEVKGSFGYAARIDYVSPDFSATSGAANWSDTRVGWTVGGGVETALTPGFLQLLGPGWKARVEYRYTDFGTYSKSIPLSFSCSGVSGCSTTPVSSNAIVNLHPTFHTIRVGLAYNF